ncbi:hypothetical protein J7E62_24490 [Variovorax paradoxus]|nr:hypothetical protein [Variovorax paradoxus]
MKALMFARPVQATAFAFAAVMGLAGPAAAETLLLELPAGLACPFALRVEGTGANLVTKTFVDEQNNPVRTITAGKGFQLTFTNLSKTMNAVTFKSNGSVSKSTFNSDGTTTVQSTGHNGIILFPTDVPPGPTTTLYTGRVTYTIDANQVWTILTTSGKSVDICDALK